MDDESTLLLEFRAGRMNFEETWVSPDTRNGIIKLVQTADDLLHFLWIDRFSGNVEEDQIVFPNEAVFEKVQQSGGRVYLLKFRNDDRKLFFWMQEALEDGDSILCEAVNHILNPDADGADILEPLPDVTPEAESSEAGQRDTIDPPVTPSMVESMSPQSNALLNVPASQADEIQKLLAGLSQIVIPQEQREKVREAQLSLSRILDPESVAPILRQPGVLDRLQSHLPEELRSVEAMKELISSPQFRQQVDAFSHMLQRGEVDWSQFGMKPSTYESGVASFLSAVMELALSEAESVEGKRENEASMEEDNEKSKKRKEDGIS